MKNLKTFFFCIFPVTPKQGLSLIEVLVVLVIISILIAIGGVGLMANLPEYRLKSAARDLISNMQKMRIQAVKNNQDTAIIFDTTNNEYSLCNDSGDENWNTENDNECPIKINFSEYKSQYGHGSASSPKGSTFGSNNVTYTPTSSNRRVVFNPRGTCGPGYVYIQNQKNDTFAIGTLSSGGIMLYRWDGSEWSE